MTLRRAGTALNPRDSGTCDSGIGSTDAEQQLFLQKVRDGGSRTEIWKKPAIIADRRLFVFGAGCRNRTGHLMITSQLLYQMS